MRKLVIIIIISLSIISCNDTTVFDTYKPISKAQWHKDSIVSFTFNPVDTLSKNNVYINIRNNNDYPYSNLFLIVDIHFPDNNTVVDTLEYEMTDAQGKFLGSGFTDIKENKLEYKTNVAFPTKGTYTFSIQHAMRKSGEVNGITLLDGITDVGLQIEKITKNGN
ncbi:MAG TPA: gliding motility lipoprotein GldH [Flavobacteriia bacterium]|nr:gliding motility lipoprotein GldH [Flavobacteriia bacterium]